VIETATQKLFAIEDRCVSKIDPKSKDEFKMGDEIFLYLSVQCVIFAGLGLFS